MPHSAPTPHDNRPAQHRDRWSTDGDVTSLARRPRAPRLVRFDARPGPVEIDLSRTALIVIDMQNDFLHPDGWFPAVRGVDVGALHGPIAAINALADGVRGASVPVIHLNWGVRADAANLPANVLDKASACGARPGYADDGVRGRVLVEGSWGAATVDEVVVAPQDIAVAKHRLSGFRDNALGAILRRLDIATIVYTGVNIDRCVFATLMDGAFEGFDPILVTDATATVSPQPVADAITMLVETLYGFTAETGPILSALSAPSAR